MNEKDFDVPPATGELQGVLRRAVDTMRAVPPPAVDFGAWQNQSSVLVGLSNNHFFEMVKNMILTHKRQSAAAAAMVTALAASLILYVFLFTSSRPAYALEQTAQANDHVTSYHTKIIPPVPEGRAKGVGESWVQLNPDGTVLRARVDRFPINGDGNDRVTFGSKDRVEFWHKAKNIRVICIDKDMIKRGLDEFMKSRALFDPKLAFEQLQADEKAGKVQVATKEPVKEGEPITLTVTSNDKPDRRQVYEIDPKTTLVQRVIEYRGGGQWQQVSERDYLDYNKEIDPKVFQPELPKDVITIDQSKIDLGKIGLPQGNLTDDQIATKVAKEFFEALIAGDYQKAGQLDGELQGQDFKKRLEREQIKFLRVVEIGSPFHDARYPREVNVPVKVEVEIKGKKTVEEKKLFVGPVAKHSDRWSIDGGF